MSEEYVRADVFNEVVKRLEERDAKIEDTAAIAISDMRDRIDDISNSQVRGLTLLALAVTFVGVLIAGVQVCIALFIR